MNDLIQSVFGDPYITLQCKSGECIHKSEIPGYTLPDNPKFTLGNLFVIIGVLLVCILAVVSLLRNISESALFKKNGYEPLDSDPSVMNQTLSLQHCPLKILNMRLLVVDKF